MELYILIVLPIYGVLSFFIGWYFGKQQGERG